MKTLGYLTVIVYAALGFSAVFFAATSVSAERAQFIANLDALKEYQKIRSQEVLKSNPKRIMLVGDIMLGRGVARHINTQGGGDTRYPFLYVADYLQSADLAFGNLEGAVSDRGKDGGSIYSFRFPPDVLQGITYAGFDVLSLANNHIWDWGSVALCDTRTHIESVGIGSVGAGCNEEQAEKPFIAEVGDTTVAFLAYTTMHGYGNARGDAPGLARFDEDKIIVDTQDLKASGIDIVFVSIHWGVEYATESNSFQQGLARRLVDSGVDVIVGHHPHVTQEIEQYGDGWIVYSLGNFIFDQYFSENTMSSFIAEVIVEGGKILDVETTDISINNNFQPTIVES